MKRTLKNGMEITIREAVVEDAQILLDYFHQVNKETKNLTREPEEFTMTLEQEEQFLQRVTDSHNHAMFLVFYDDRLIATGGIHGSSLARLRHKVSFGISVFEQYHNMGIGTCLMEVIIMKAKELKLHKIELEVRNDNPNAIHLYEKLGFFTEGIREDGFYVDGKYIGLRQMGLILEGK